MKRNEDLARKLKKKERKKKIMTRLEEVEHAIDAKEDVNQDKEKTNKKYAEKLREVDKLTSDLKKCEKHELLAANKDLNDLQRRTLISIIKLKIQDKDLD